MKDFRFSCLRMAKVHHLVEKLVYNNVVVPDTFFFELLEVLGKDLHDFVQEEQNLSGIGVSFGNGK